MPALFVFLLKVNIALILFCLGYYLVLRRLTFYTLNRIYLITAIVFSSIYPLIDVSSFFQHSIPVQTVIINWKAPAEKFIQQPGYWHWAEMIFWAGVVLFAIRLLVQLISLHKLHRSSEPEKAGEHKVRIVHKDINPFSFWQSIYINPANIAVSDLENILQHEQVHVNEWHTLDILLTEISVIFYWFNPGVWLIKKAVRENIEFITDREILRKGIDSKTYQYSLLNVSFGTKSQVGVANHFNFSTLKKRIIMMNAKRSSKFNLTRYVLLIPAVVVLLLVFSFSKAALLKKNNNTYKPIVSLVNSLKKANAVNHTSGKIITVDLIRKRKQIKSIDNETADSSKKALIKDSTNWYIDGKKSSENEVIKINTDGEVQSILVSTDKQSNRPSVLVQTKSAYNASINDSGNKETNENLTHSRKSIITESNLYLLTDKLVFIDGKQATEKDISKLPTTNIWSMIFNKDITGKYGDKDMVGKYGDKAKNGLIYITTKK